MDLQQWLEERQSRRTMLKQLGGLVGAGVAATLGLSRTSAFAAHSNSFHFVPHVLIACQENRTFDHYFGYYNRAGSFGIPTGYSQPDGNGGTVYPYHFPSTITADISHTWQSIHSEWNMGNMDGFYTTDGSNAMGYYNQSDLSYYYSLAKQFVLCANYFCYQIGPTLPNRLALWTGTCGGITNNNLTSSTLNWPTIVDLLDQYQISWKCYNLGSGTGSKQEGYNALAFFQKWVLDPRLYYQESDYYQDLQADTLPEVSFLITEESISEHPISDIKAGQQKMQQVITALQNAKAWWSSAFFLTYDEGGGYFDHVSPPQVDAYGMGCRVPMLVISPYVKHGYVSVQLYEHSSILKFIELLFGLPSLASVNHQFDQQTSGTNNDAANGKSFGPPAPPRDGLSQIGNFVEAFNIK